MAVYSFKELQTKIAKSNNEDLYNRICRNIKKVRKEKYREFKKTSANNAINPYTTENIATLLNYNHTHYKRFESENDATKKIPLKKLVLISIILETSIEDLMKK